MKSNTKFLGITLILIALAGCATNQRRPTQYYNVSNVRINEQTCDHSDALIRELDAHLRSIGYAGKNPEELSSEAERAYNREIKQVIWRIRIGCYKMTGQRQ